MPAAIEWQGVSILPAPVAWPESSRIVFAGLPWRDPLDDIVRAEDRDLVEEALAAFARSADALHPSPSRRDAEAEAGELPLRRALAGRFAARGDRVLYLSRELTTAIAETRHHQERRARRSRDPAHPIPMRVLTVRGVRAGPHDLRGKAAILPDLHDPDDYTPSVHFAHALRRGADPDGILYESVRAPGGLNLALFRKRYAAIAPGGDIEFDWDGTRIRGWRRAG